ncbi:4Fe-4S binding protein [Erysipelotrichaceae bacterium OttesenSCG-928-M19]|nr:4Fe-4S binding protein [Erysipelotrichaceae bacterium OttesenSCG-928-M19]
MEVKDYFNKLREVRDVSIATIDKKGIPQVRIIDVMIVKEDRLFFLVARGKAFYQQLLNNPTVALVGLTKDWESIRMMGRVEHCNQDMLVDIFADNPNMYGIYPGDSSRILEVFCLKDGYGEYFNLSGHPIYREYFSFGTGKIKEEGYLITHACQLCNKCYESCPQSCIEVGRPYQIVKENCLHCGLCYEVCPYQAIRMI